jgi:hypothetical protein
MGFSLVGQNFFSISPNFFSVIFLMGQKFFLHKNEKVCYNIINTCSCGLSFLGKLAGLVRRGLVYVSAKR